MWRRGKRWPRLHHFSQPTSACEAMADEAEAGGSISSAAGGKPTSSTYYAWNQETQKRKEELSRLGVDIAPKPVAAAAASPVTPSAGSAWNAAGTW